jgi:hypothetical protein
MMAGPPAVLSAALATCVSALAAGALAAFDDVPPISPEQLASASAAMAANVGMPMIFKLLIFTASPF